MNITASELKSGCLSGKLEVNEYGDGRVELFVAPNDPEEFKRSANYLLSRPNFNGTCYLKLPLGLGALESAMLVGTFACWCDYVALYDHCGKYVVASRPTQERAFGGPPLYRTPEIGDELDESNFVEGPKDPLAR
jgi:hypothetical protein